MIRDIFKLGIYVTQLNLDNKNMAQYCLNYKENNQTVNRSNEGGYQSEPLKGEHKELNDLFVAISHHQKEYSKQLSLDTNADTLFPWINVNGYKDFNVTHNHAHSILSGVYYVQTPEDCGNIHFINPVKDLLEPYWRHQPQINAYLSNEYYLEAKEGILCLFPSFLNHFVQPNKNKTQKRISISFNIF